MSFVEPLPLTHSWPLYEAAERLPAAGRAPTGAEMPGVRDIGQNAGQDIGPDIEPGLGMWSCTLHDNALRWTPSVYTLFGLPRDEPLTRPLAVSLYLPESREAMEMLRAHAIRHKRGFTLDVQIRRPDGDIRWMRLSALPELRDGHAWRLWGTKQDVTAEYDGIG